MNDVHKKLFGATIVLLIASSGVESATVRDIFNLDADPLLRVPRDNKYFLDRYGSGSSRDDASSRTLKPEESAEARDAGATGTNVEKRCSGCDSGYPDYRSPYDGGRYSSRYDNTRGTRDRYDDLTDRYDNYYDRYDTRDRYNDRDRYDRRPDNYNYNDRYDRDRYDTRDRYYNRDPYYDRYDRDRGFGYDNRGYDYRGYDSSRNSYRPWDETYRGTSGWDNTGRGYYFATGRPEYGGGYGSGYASSWNSGRGDDRDYRYRDQGYYGSPQQQSKPRDYYDYGYRGTSYLYARPSSSTTTSSSNPSDGDNSVTDAPRDSSPSDPIFFNIKSLPLKIIDKKSI